MGYSELGWVEKSIDVVSQVLILEALNSIPFNPKSSTILPRFSRLTANS